LKRETISEGYQELIGSSRSSSETENVRIPLYHCRELGQGYAEKFQADYLREARQVLDSYTCIFFYSNNTRVNFIAMGLLTS